MRTLARWAVWWVALACLWLVYQGEWNRVEWIAAASAASLGATLAVALRRQERAALRLEAGGFLQLVKVPWQILRDFALLTLFLVLRRRSAGIRRLPFATGGARPAERGRRVLAALALTYSPNSYVIDMDEEAHEVVVHTLYPVPPGEELL